MARRKRRIKKMSGFKLGSLGRIKGSEVPLLVAAPLGMTATNLSTLLMRKFSKDDSAFTYRYASLLGGLGGIIASVPLYWWGGVGAVVSGALSSVATAANFYAAEAAYSSGWALPSTSALVASKSMGAMHELEGGYGGNVLPSAQVPGGVRSAMDVTAFGGYPT